MADSITTSAEYLDDLLNVRETLRRASMVLRKGQKQDKWDDDKGLWTTERQRPIEFDTLVGIGFSGTLLLPMIADRLKVNYLALRKEGVSSHSSQHQGKLGKKWMFWDDLISSGSTLQTVYAAVDKLANKHSHKTEFVGAYLFARPEYALRTGADLKERYDLQTHDELAAKEAAFKERVAKEAQVIKENSVFEYANLAGESTVEEYKERADRILFNKL